MPAERAWEMRGSGASGEPSKKLSIANPQNVSPEKVQGVLLCCTDKAQENSKLAVTHPTLDRILSVRDAQGQTLWQLL